jgi:RNA polymerase sigma-54 factor
MLKQSLSQKLLQKLSPQQIQFIKLLQMTTADFEERVDQELLDNPALEKSEEDFATFTAAEKKKEEFNNEESINDDFNSSDHYDTEDFNVSEFLNADDSAGFKMTDDYNQSDEEQKELPIAYQQSFYDFLVDQTHANFDNEEELQLALHLVGNIEEDGYLRRELDLIVDDLAFNYNITTSVPELEKALKLLQSFDPPGVGARNLQECLLLQLERKTDKTKEVMLAMDVIKHQMDEFSKKHYDKILKRLHIENDELKDVIEVITHLNPRPGNSETKESNFTAVIPDFIIAVNDGVPELSINGRNLPDLKISRDYF